MSRTALTTLAAAGVFAVSAVTSGLLIDERSGLPGAVEWLARTLVVLAVVPMLGGASVLVLRLRRRVRPRPLGWLLAGAAWAAFAWLAIVPVVYGVHLTHLPARKPVVAGDLAARSTPVTVTGADGIRIRGWYVPSRTGAAVIALHGTGGTRSGVAAHTRLLARHGYGVLALDLRGHGESGGRSTSVPWRLDDDLDGALGWLRRRPDVNPSRIGALGVSLGGEVALQLAARRPDVRAVVAEGAMGDSPADMRAAGADPAVVAQSAVMFAVAGVLAGARPPASDLELVRRVAPRPRMLVSSGRGTEAEANAAFARRGGDAVRTWNLPGAAHGSALGTAPAGYERRVVGFLDAALSARPARAGKARSQTAAGA